MSTWSDLREKILSSTPIKDRTGNINKYDTFSTDLYKDNDGRLYTKHNLTDGIRIFTTNTGISNIDLSGISFAGAQYNGKASEVCKTCFQTFMSAGCCEGAALGICANIAVESGFNPSIVTWDGSVKSGIFGVGGGLCGFYFNGALKDLASYCGWSAEQLNAYNNQIKNSGLPYPTIPCHSANAKHIQSMFGGFPFSFEQQLKYLCKIISGSHSGIKNINDPETAALWWTKNYEHPAKITNRWASHGNLVLSYLKK